MQTATDTTYRIYGIDFTRIDKRGRDGFPKNGRGFVYFVRRGGWTYIIRHASKIATGSKPGWWVSKMDNWTGIEEVGIKGEFSGFRAAARALSEKLNAR